MIRALKLGILMIMLITGAWGFCAGQSTQDQPPPQNPPSPEPSAPQTAAPAPQAQAPEPESQTKTTENQSASPQSPTPDANVPVLKRRPKKTIRKKTAGKSQSDQGAKTQSGKVVVRNGGAKEGSPQLAPGMSQEQALHNRENTSQLLATTDQNLKLVSGRQLTPAQQSMLEEIRAYMHQSKAASDAGDLNRAHTLAYKAHLLSDELAKK